MSIELAERSTCLSNVRRPGNLGKLSVESGNDTNTVPSQSYALSRQCKAACAAVGWVCTALNVACRLNLFRGLVAGLARNTQDFCEIGEALLTLANQGDIGRETQSQIGMPTLFLQSIHHPGLQVASDAQQVAGEVVAVAFAD